MNLLQINAPQPANGARLAILEPGILKSATTPDEVQEVVNACETNIALLRDMENQLNMEEVDAYLKSKAALDKQMLVAHTLRTEALKKIRNIKKNLHAHLTSDVDKTLFYVTEAFTKLGLNKDVMNAQQKANIFDDCQALLRNYKQAVDSNIQKDMFRYIKKELENNRMRAMPQRDITTYKEAAINKAVAKTKFMKESLKHGKPYKEVKAAYKFVSDTSSSIETQKVQEEVLSLQSEEE
jgi:hypothetical protein